MNERKLKYMDLTGIEEVVRGHYKSLDDLNEGHIYLGVEGGRYNVIFVTSSQCFIIDSFGTIDIQGVGQCLSSYKIICDVTNNLEIKINGKK